eukprot:gene10075-20994_t
MEYEYEVSCQGWMRKKGSRVNVWGDRYFVLRGPSLYYFLKENDAEPKGVFALQATCRVSHIRSDFNKKRSQFLFSIIWPVDEDLLQNEEGIDGDIPKTKDSSRTELKKKVKRRMSGPISKSEKAQYISGGGIAAVAVGGIVLGALTAGVGLVAGMVIVGMGAAAGGGAVAVQHAVAEKEKYLTLACKSHQEAEKWVSCIESQIRKLGDSIFGLPYIPGCIMNSGSKGHHAPQQIRLEEIDEWIRSSTWRVSNVVQGIRIFEQSNRFISKNNDSSFTTSHESSSSTSTSMTDLPPCLRINMSMNGSPSDVFMSIMKEKTAVSVLPGIIKSMRIIETINNYTDIVHIILDPIFIYPTWTSPRDFCVMRYWRNDSDGSYAICMDSTFHHDCPLVLGYVRFINVGVGRINVDVDVDVDVDVEANVSHKEGDNEDEFIDSMLTLIAQGWIWRDFGYQQKYLEQIQFDLTSGDHIGHNVTSSNSNHHHHNSSGNNPHDESQATQGCSIANTPPPALPAEMWSEPDAASFKIRGKTYNQDKVKASSAPSLFKLLAIDLFETEGNIFNIASHPKNRVFQALQRGEDSWTFIVPGPPFYSFVVYMSGERSLFTEDTPFARIARTFFFGNDDDFRNNRFKLIPKVIDGNMIIKMAVKDTPTLLGNKLKQYYFK